MRGEEVTIAGEDSAHGRRSARSRPPCSAPCSSPGFDVLIDDGAVRLRVGRVERGRASCEVLVPAARSARTRASTCPGVPLPIPSLTQKDIDDLQFALELGCDFVALSFVRTASDVQALKTLIEASGSTAHVIAKIEKAEAVAVLDDIMRDADAVMVARGDLGVEIGAAEVPLLQKRIILRALERGKPVITATQMLESMIHAPEPTRAEASDVANAILDGTSAIMLSGETAVGEFPVEAVAYMDRIARAVEPSLDYRHEIPRGRGGADDRPGDVERRLRHRRGARSATAILVPTFTGRTASAVARLRPRRPIIGLTHHAYSLRHMALEWGVTPGAASPSAPTSRSSGRPRSRRRASTGHRRAGRPGRHHGRHGGEHPRLDERDQGRHRLDLWPFPWTEARSLGLVAAGGGRAGSPRPAVVPRRRQDLRHALGARSA